MTIRDVIEAHGHFAHGGNPDDTAETWAESGFEANEVEEWSASPEGRWFSDPETRCR